MNYTGERLILEAEECAPNTLLYKEHIERYKFASQYVKNKVVLDIACGVGYGSEFLLNTGQATQVYGGDISEDAVNYAKQKYGKYSNISFAIMNAEKISIENKIIDVVVSFETMEHLPNVDSYLESVYQTLKPNGMFIVSTPNREVTHSETFQVDNPFHFHEFTKEEFDQKLKKYYKKVDLYYQRQYTPTAISSAIKSMSGMKKIYRKIIPKIIRVDLRNFLFPDISNDYLIHPYIEGVKPLNYIAVCQEKR